MLSAIGVEHIDDLFTAIPAAYKFAGPLQMEPALDEPRLMQHLNELASKQTQALSFLGAGSYAHHVPPALDQLLMRSEFYTAYTPYQAEVSQGTLQAIYEFQTIVCELFGQDVSNASMYDGASAAAEAVLMARRVTKRSTVVVSEGLHPDYIRTIETYLAYIDDTLPIVRVPVDADGRTDLNAVRAALNDDVAAVIVGYPNFFGVVENVVEARTLAHDVGALLVTVTMEPYALSVLKSPGSLGADICAGEGQPIAITPQFGGPGVGLLACGADLVRQIPGRLVGATKDHRGDPGFVLTLSTREQHIRRERATSNICTNHGLIALAMVIRVALLGREGFDKTGRICLQLAEYFKAQLTTLDGVTLPHRAPTFNEFVIRFASREAQSVVDALATQGIYAGVPLSQLGLDAPNDLLVAVTELHTRADIDHCVTVLRATLGR